MSRRNILTTIVLGPALFAAALPADTVFVSAVSSGLWSNPNIWSPAVVPNDSDGTNYDVVVASPLRSMNGPSVTVDINPTVDTLNVGPYFGNLDVASGSTLTTGLLGVGFGSRMTVDGTLNVGGSSAGVPSSTLTIAATGTANFADFSDSLIINNEGVLNIVNLSKSSTEEITNIGILNITNSAGGILPGGTVNLGVGNGTTTLSVFPGGSTINNGDLSLSGTLSLVLGNSFVPQIGEVIPIIQSPGGGTIAGTFDNVVGATFNNGTEVLDVIYHPQEVDVIAEAASVPEPSFFVLAGLGFVGIVSIRSATRAGDGA